MARRAFLMILAAPLLADVRQEILDLLTAMASALSEGNGLAFLDHVDHSMRDYDKLERSILALTAQNEVASSIDLLLERRRETLTCGLVRGKKKWKVASLEPISFFAPPA